MLARDRALVVRAVLAIAWTPGFSSARGRTRRRRGLLHRRRCSFGNTSAALASTACKMATSRINSQRLRHPASNSWIPLLQVYRPSCASTPLSEELADRSPCAIRARLAFCCWPCRAATSQQPRRPEFVRVSHLLYQVPGTPRPCPCGASTVMQPSFARPTIVESNSDPEPACPCQATLDRWCVTPTARPTA